MPITASELYNDGRLLSTVSKRLKIVHYVAVLKSIVEAVLSVILVLVLSIYLKRTHMELWVS
jgi:hypothetical protein